MNLKDAQAYVAKIFESVDSQTVAQVKTIQLSLTSPIYTGPEYQAPTYVLTVQFETAELLSDV